MSRPATGNDSRLAGFAERLRRKQHAGNEWRAGSRIGLRRDERDLTSTTKSDEFQTQLRRLPAARFRSSRDLAIQAPGSQRIGGRPPDLVSLKDQR